jgi:hypothetical protein
MKTDHMHCIQSYVCIFHSYNIHAFLLQFFMRTFFIFSDFSVLKLMLSFQPGTTLFGPSEQHMTFSGQRKIPQNYLHCFFEILYAGTVKSLCANFLHVY